MNFINGQALCSVKGAVVLAVVIAIRAGAQNLPIVHTIQAEAFSGLQGTSFNPPAKDGKGDFETVNNLGNGDWISFDGINFGDSAYQSVTLFYSSGYIDQPTARVRLRLDSPTGTIIATVNGIPASGMASGLLSSTAGVHSVYLTFEGGATILNLDKLQLSGNMAIKANDAKTYYVSTLGDDANNGLSTTAPFRTISKAAAVMRPGSRCLIRQGIYREMVKGIVSGLAGVPLSFEPYPNELVYIDGADPITGWTNHSGNMYKAPMNWSIGKYKNQVLVDGKMAWAACSPNVDDTYMPDQWLNWCGPGVFNWKPWQAKTEPIALRMGACWNHNGSYTFSMYVRDPNNPPPCCFDMAVDNSPNSATRLPASLFGRPADFFKGGLLTILGNWYWMNAGEVTGSSSASAIKTVITASRTDLMEKDGDGKGWISHVFGLLDAPNEWYLDSTQQMLYLITPDGGDPSHHLVEAKKRPLGFDLRGKQYVNVKGLYFLATSMSLADASHCIIDGCHFKYVSHNDNPPFHELGGRLRYQAGIERRPSGGLRIG